MPKTPFMGVRISWLMLARNSLLARLAASAASFAFCISAIRLRSVMSWAMDETPTTLPSASTTEEADTATGAWLPSFRTRTVSKWATRSPRWIASRICDSSSRRSGGSRREAGRPNTSSAA